MRIGVDATCWAHGRGYGRFTRELVTHLAALAPNDDLVCFLDPASAARFALVAPNVHPVTVAQTAAPTAAASAEGSRSPRDMLRLTRAVSGAGLDVFFVPTVYTFFPLPPGLRAVVTIHDCIAERFPDLTLPSRRARLFWSAKVWLALRQATLVLTVSDYAARDLQRVLGVPAGKIRVATEAPAAVFRPGTLTEAVNAATRLGIPTGASWFTYVGGFSPHKHVDLLVAAHGALAREMGAAAPHLLLVGALSGDAFLGDQPRIRAAIAAAGAEALVHWTGFVDDAELRHLHTGALALLLPSAVEGFGLPAVEAAACGTPVIATTESPLPELLTGGGLFVPPGDAPALLAALRVMATDEPARQAMGERAGAAVARLSWDAAARVALAALREAA